MKHERQHIVDSILRIPSILQSDIKRALYQLRKHEGMCANPYCTQKASAEGVLCPKHQSYQADYRQRGKKT